MSGHLFITHGNLLHLHCDAILIPSGKHPTLDRPGYIKHDWATLDLEVDADGCLRRAPDVDNRVIRVREASEDGPAIWAAHASGHDREADWYTAPIRIFIEAN